MNYSDVDQLNALIHPLARVSVLALIGAPAEWLDHDTHHPAVIEAGVVVREFARVHAGTYRETIVGARTLLMAGSHVGHDCIIGEDCNIAPNAVVGGCVTVGDRTKVGMGVVIKPYVTIGSDCVIGAGAVVTSNVPDGEVWVGNPARKLRNT